MITLFLWLLRLFILTMALFFAWMNHQSIDVRLWPSQETVFVSPLFLVVFTSLFLGLFFGQVFGLLGRLKLKHKIRSLEKTVEKQQKEAAKREEEKIAKAAAEAQDLQKKPSELGFLQG